MKTITLYYIYDKIYLQDKFSAVCMGIFHWKIFAYIAMHRLPGEYILVKTTLRYVEGNNLETINQKIIS